MQKEDRDNKDKNTKPVRKDEAIKRSADSLRDNLRRRKPAKKSNKD